MSCQTHEKTTHKITNDLIHESSPYLLQHAYNPVQWKAWNDESLTLAKKEHKLIIISIGYAACHWCHVMEEESFEDHETATIMNSNFINIKVDREERPDVDQVYMNAVQLMTGSGGWPLHVIALPDGRPVWGGTYFRKHDWIKAITKLNHKFKEQPESFYAFAEQLEQGVITSNLININNKSPELSFNKIDLLVSNWKKTFDYKHGGRNRSPKFMLPNNHEFLLKYAYLKNDHKILDYVNLTLHKMAYGGVFDQVGGGFSRYSTDIRWHVPHFEKMLYDNAQLISLYSQAYKLTKNKLYKNTIEKTIHFIEQELSHQDGYFYSSLDADSYNRENTKEEGAYYIWKKEELKKLLQNDYPVFSDYYNINEYGYWQQGNYILTRKNSNQQIFTKYKIDEIALQHKLTNCLTILNNHRNKRKKPSLDDKSLTSWNALMLTGYLEAYEALGNPSYLSTAQKNAQFIIDHQLKKDGSLFHSYKNKKSSINGYLEDYATTISAFIKLYENTLNDSWLFIAKDLTDYCFEHFHNSNNNLFYFTSNKDSALVIRPLEYRDHVIPASNSVMAKNLFILGKHFNHKKYSDTAKKMLQNILPKINNNASGFSNWLDLYLNYIIQHKETVVIGDNALTEINQLKRNYLPNTLFSGYDTSIKNNLSSTNLPLIKNRVSKGTPYFYICKNSVCYLPTNNSKTALTLINK